MTKYSLFTLLFIYFLPISIYSQIIPLSSTWVKTGNHIDPITCEGMTTGDVNGDGRLDFIATPRSLNLGNNQTFFSTTWTDWAFPYTFYRHQGNLGDHNGDGRKDVVLISDNTVSVFFGNATGLPAAPSQTYTITGATCNLCSFGDSFDGGGDINNDGFDDLIIGIPRTVNQPDGNRGNLFVVYGSATGLKFNEIVKLERPYLGTYFASQARFAGDVNHDGFDDILVATESFAGQDFDEKVYIIYGKTGVLGDPFSIGEGGRSAEDYAHEIGAAGDLNGDGFDDFYISAGKRAIGGTTRYGSVEIVYGKAGIAPNLDSNIVELRPNSTFEAGYFGKSVSSASDFNDDGFGDLAVSHNNQVLIYLGSAQGVATEPRYSFPTICPPTLRRAGDVDNDRFGDLLVGEQLGVSPIQLNTGRVHLLRGRTSMIPKFNVAQREICTQNPVATFQDSSIEAVSRVWNFGDGTTSTALNPTHRYAAAGIYSVKLTTRDVFGHETFINRDSFIIVRQPMTGGIYTIGAGGNFQTTQQVNDVCKCGLNGNVTMKIKNDFNDTRSLRFENIATNGFSFIFESESGNPDDVILGQPIYEGFAPVLIIKNSKNINFRNLTIARSVGLYVTDHSGTIQMDSAENIKFENCRFPVSYNRDHEFDTTIVVHTVKNLTFNDCVFELGYYALYVTGCDGFQVNRSRSGGSSSNNSYAFLTVDTAKNVSVTQSTYLYLNFRHSENIKIEQSNNLPYTLISDSKKVNLNQNGENLKISLKDIVGLKIQKNKHANEGVYDLVNVTGLDTEGYNLIANNACFVDGPNTLSRKTGIFLNNCRNLRVQHNTMISEIPTDGFHCDRPLLRVENSDSIDVRNNIFSTTALNLCPFLQIENNQRYTADYNAYVNGYYFNTNIANSHALMDFDEFRRTLGQDSHSTLGTLRLKPDHITPTPETGGLINNAAPFIAQILDDINGNPRLTTGADMGALEFVAPNLTDFSVNYLQNQGLLIGDNRIAVHFTNRTGSRADSCKFAYQLNGGDIIRERWTGNMAGFESKIFTFTRPLSIPNGKVYILKIWLENTIEALRANDTLVRDLTFPMGGNYTISGIAPDFKTIDDFFKDVDIADTRADVVGLLRNGTYKLLDTLVHGSYRNRNWLILRGDNRNTEGVRLKTGFFAMPNLRLENLTIEATPHQGTNFQTNRLVIDSCLVQTDSLSRINNELNNLTLLSDSGIVVKNSRFRYLDEALSVGNSYQNWNINAVRRAQRLTVENCIFTNVGVAILHKEAILADLRIVNNVIDSARVGFEHRPASRPMWDEYDSRGLISQNRFLNCRESGILFDSDGESNVMKTLISNNFIHSAKNTLNLFGSINHRVINNSCYGTARLQMGFDTMIVLNNSFVAPDTAAVWSSGNVDIRNYFARVSNFNNYYSLSSKPLRLLDITVFWDSVSTDITIDSFRRLTHGDSNSISANPRYFSPTNMHIDSLSPLNSSGGGIFFGVKTDIDGQVRDSIRNDIGADEINTPSVVMPGDANFDRIVDMFDLFSLGVAVPQQLIGTPRANASINWTPQLSANWLTNVLATNAKHSDTNGDGQINLADTLAVSRNYGNRHAYRVVRNRSASPPLFFSDMPKTLVAGTWVTASVHLGDAATTVNDVYSLIFNVDYDSTKIQKGSLSLSFDTCWIGTAAQRLTLTKDVGNQLQVGIVRTTGTPIAGKGMIGKLRFQVRQAVAGPTVLAFVEPVLVNNRGVKTDVTAKNDSVKIALTGTNLVRETSAVNALSVVPNPISNTLLIKKETAYALIPCEWWLYDVMGKTVRQGQFSTSEQTTDVSDLPNGLYVLKCHLGNEIWVEKVIKTE